MAQVNSEERDVEVSPFLKWAGGKRSLILQLREFIPANFQSFHEPFLGAGSMFFSMPEDARKYVNDFNGELILTYQALRDDLEGVIRELSQFRNEREFYLSVRSWDRDPGLSTISTSRRAARFIYLNKVGFNGIYRLNRDGFFNVPFGSGGNKDFIAEARLRAVSKFLSSKDSYGAFLTQFSNLDISEWRLETNDSLPFVYFDPPYYPVSTTAGFVDYNENGFGAEKQEIVRDKALEIARNGGKVMLSNSDTDFIRSLYSSRTFKIHTIKVRRSIAAKSSSRGVTTEVVITNYKPRGMLT